MARPPTYVKSRFEPQVKNLPFDLNCVVGVACEIGMAHACVRGRAGDARDAPVTTRLRPSGRPIRVRATRRGPHITDL